MNTFGGYVRVKSAVLDLMIQKNLIILNGLAFSTIYFMANNARLLRWRWMRWCPILAQNSTKVIEFVDVKKGSFDNFSSNSLLAEMKANYESVLENQGFSLTMEEKDETIEDDEFLSFTLRIDLSGIAVSVVDNVADAVSGREILLFQMDSWVVEFSQNRDGYHELEMRLMSLQMDNHVHQAVHPVLVSLHSKDSHPSTYSQWNI
eukprot:2267727-Ditylum_brightwellii.AAC.1